VKEILSHLPQKDGKVKIDDFINKDITSEAAFKVKPTGVNFINIFCTAFTSTDPKIAKNTDDSTEFLRF
jgi:hypothetical protein